MAPRVDAEGLVVLVTGATAGFGEAICRRFAAEGARVIAAGRREERLERLVKALGARGHAVVLDVRDRKAVDAAVAALPAPFARPNVVVANAGLALGLDPAPRADPADWEAMVATNVNGVLNVVRAVLPGMAARDEGHVVLMGSISGDYAYAGGSVYCASKAFVKQFARALRADLLGSRVRVTNVEPGLAETEFSLVRFKGDARKAERPYQGLTPLSADDVAEAVFWSCTLPRHVNVDRLQLLPVSQAPGPTALARRGPRVGTRRRAARRGRPAPPRR